MDHFPKERKKQKLSFESLVKFWGEITTTDVIQDASTSNNSNILAGTPATNSTTVLKPAHVTSSSDKTLPDSDWLGGQRQDDEDQWGGGIED